MKGEEKAALVFRERCLLLELPQVAFRSALNLILEPLKLTYVIENEVLKITTKTAAASVEVDTPKAARASQMGTLAYSFSAMRGGGGMGGGGMGGGMGGAGGRDSYGLASVQRYRTFQEAQNAKQNASAPTSMMGGMGGMGGTGGNASERRELTSTVNRSECTLVGKSFPFHNFSKHS